MQPDIVLSCQVCGEGVDDCVVSFLAGAWKGARSWGHLKPLHNGELRSYPQVSKQILVFFFSGLQKTCAETGVLWIDDDDDDTNDDSCCHSWYCHDWE